MFQHALCYALVILSSAISRIPAELRAKQPSAPWAVVQETGALMGYAWRDRIDNKAVWHVLTTHMAPLRAAVHSIIAEQDEQGLPL